VSDLILIVEDNEKNMKLARDLLEYHGFAIVTADNAEDGLAIAREKAPKLILMDIQLPGMDGVTALAQLRSDAATAQVPVVAMTASAVSSALLPGAWFTLSATARSRFLNALMP